MTGAWFFVALIAVFIAVGIGVGVLTYLRRTRLASYIFIAASFVIVCAVAWVLDVPSSDRTPGAILQPQPPPWDSEVRRGSDWTVMFTLIRLAQIRAR